MLSTSMEAVLSGGNDLWVAAAPSIYVLHTDYIDDMIVSLQLF